MSFISLFCPAFISLALYLNLFNRKRDVLNDLSYYFICNMIVNSIVLLTVRFVFGHEEITWTIVFTIKYLFMSSIVSCILPFIINYLNNNVGKWLLPAKKIIDTGFNKNGEFSFKLLYKKNKKLFNSIIFIASSFLFFYIIEFAIRITAVKIGDFGHNIFMSPFLFTICYYIIFLLFQLYLPRVLSKIFSIINYIFYIVLFIVNYMLLHIKSEALSVGELTNASEGAKYLNFIIKEINVVFIIVVVLIVICAIVNYIFLNRVNIRRRVKPILISLLVIIACYLLGLLVLPSSKNDWENVNTERYYYYNFVNSKRSLAVLGLYEYTYRDMRLSLVNKFSKYGTNEEIETIIKKHHVDIEKNDYTGIFKDKNLVMVMLESIDYATVEEDVMPTFTKILNNGWSFPERYSALSDGGSTILTEYVSQTGLFYNPSLYEDIFKSDYTYSLPNMFNNNGYVTNSMHANSGSYYNRQELHRLLGFNNSYFIKDMNKNGKYVLYNDSQMIDYNELYSKIIPQDKEKFMSFIITITPHGPYDETNTICNENNHNSSQKDCFNYLAEDTDKFIDHLVKKLDNDGLLDDTIIVLYTDHPAYAYDYPEAYLNSLKQIDKNKKIKSIPFVIYNPNLEAKVFNNLIINDTDIVPTLLNMFGIEYNSDDYLGVDMFSSNHKNLALFTDGSWYDGNIYSANQNIDTNTKNYRTNSQYVMDKLELNKMILSNHYYNKNNRNN